MGGCAPTDIGLLIFAAVSADVFEPAVANIVQEKIGATAASVLDIRAGANSFLYALHNVMAMTDMQRPVLLTTGEVLSTQIRTAFASPEELELGLAGLGRGDAGAAILLEPDLSGGPNVPFGRFATQGRHWRTAFVESGGVRRGSDLSDGDIKIDAPAFEQCVTDVLPGLLRDAGQGGGWRVEDIVVVSNLSAERSVAVVEHAGLTSGQVLTNVETFGDTGAASIPLALCHAADDGRVAGGQRLVLLGAAAGFSGAAVPFEWRPAGS
jgi:3-oxoacyl-[acyl-carrier-protein] synthase-3